MKQDSFRFGANNQAFDLKEKLFLSGEFELFAHYLRASRRFKLVRVLKVAEYGRRGRLGAPCLKKSRSASRCRRKTPCSQRANFAFKKTAIADSQGVAQ
jgi:hypothetical protein